MSHDMEQAHGLLAKTRRLRSSVYDARQIRQRADSENSLNRINQHLRMLNLFCFVMNHPKDKHEKVEKLMGTAVNCRILHRYRG